MMDAEALNSLYSILLTRLMDDLGASCATAELTTGGAVTIYSQRVPADAHLQWMDVPLIVEGEIAGRLRMAFDSRTQLPERAALAPSQTLIDLVAVLNRLAAAQPAPFAQQASRRILAVTEEELQRIVLDIHDGPVQKLFAALMQLELTYARLEKPYPSEQAGMRAELDQVAGLLEASLNEVRVTLGVLRHPEFRRRDLITIIENLIEEHESLTGMHTEFGADGFAAKTNPPRQTLAAIRNVAHGQTVFPRMPTRPPDGEGNPLRQLSDRERGLIAHQ